MTIQDAINSGKRFKRPKHDLWYELSYEVLAVNRVDILATDWEIEAPTRTISAQDIRDAYKDEDQVWFWHVEFIIKKLGLE